MREITFPCGELSLEGICHSPEGEGPFAAVVVCHPHPLYGGSMSNNVVLAVCQALAQQSILALRFNFRGVGGSQGELADEATGQEDVRAALSYVASVEDVDRGRVGLCGYSFGAGVAVTGAASEEQVRAGGGRFPTPPALGRPGPQRLCQAQAPYRGQRGPFHPG